MQLELLDRPEGLTRASARRIAAEAAEARAKLGSDRAGQRADAAVPEWCNQAAEALRKFAKAQAGVFTIEIARAGIGDSLPPPPDLRAWGKATVIAISAGYIQRVPRVFIPAASSNGCAKPAWRSGSNA